MVNERASQAIQFRRLDDVARSSPERRPELATDPGLCCLTDLSIRVLQSIDYGVGNIFEVVLF